MRRLAGVLLAFGLIVYGGGSTAAGTGAAAPAGTECRGAPKYELDGTPAEPQPMTPAGPLHAWRSEFWDSSLTMLDNGLCVIDEGAPGSFALTGAVIDGRNGNPVRGALVTLSTTGRRRSRVVAETVTDEQGAFAFAHMPIHRDGTCYRESITAAGLGPFTYTDEYWAESYQQAVELDDRPQLERTGASRFC